MKTYLISVILFFSLNAFAGFNPEINSFLMPLPNKITCEGTELNTGIIPKRTKLTSLVNVSISDKDTDHPMIEVFAPGASKEHFKIGNGFEGELESHGNHGYYLLKEKGVLYYLRIPYENYGDIDFDYILRLRDARALTSFSSDRICLHLFCIELSNCKTE
jgi:hypothetical protein